MVLHSSTGADEPDEILVMDKPEIEKATKGLAVESGRLGLQQQRLRRAVPPGRHDGRCNQRRFHHDRNYECESYPGGVLQSTNGKFVSNLDTGVTTLTAGWL